MPGRVNFTIRASGINEVVAEIENYQSSSVTAIKNVVNTSAVKITANAKDRCPVDLGRLRASIAMNPSYGGLEVEVGTNVEYAPYVEFGTRGGVKVPAELAQFAEQYKRGNGMPPEGVLIGWMQRHGIPASAEYVIRRAIQKKGTHAQPFLFPSYEEEKSHYLDALRRALGR